MQWHRRVERAVDPRATVHYTLCFTSVQNMAPRPTWWSGLERGLNRLEADDDVSDLGPRDVAVRMLFAPINPSDVNQVRSLR